MVPNIQSVCYLRQTLRPGEMCPLMGLTLLQVRETMSLILDTFQPTFETKKSWVTANEQYDKSNRGHTTYRDLLGSSQQSRDLDLLTKRHEIFNQTILKGLFPPGTLDFHFIPTGSTEWTQNRARLCLDGYTVSNRIVCDTTPETFKAIVVIFEKPRIRCNTTRMKVTTGTLLHELVHAILEAYACGCPKCAESMLEGEGLTGHGPVWMTIALNTEKTMLRVFGYRCWLGRSQSLAHEHHIAGHRHTEKELLFQEVNERLYCEARMDFALGETRSGISFNDEDFAEKGGGVEDIEGLESDYSEDDESESDMVESSNCKI
ncbi:hypothetical protein ONS95_012345 [Cadophora gregata]|uniref:uncharacterized protein n=1 Tax=Cadophora gregata TaxID=51156 RepID=UPI0026DDB930|nr:uncharacterized protein ONS95_012345 [Cadophora gregata]KAK0118035.1 hypothetical protein ONS95_012345 [Cadophora gregata]KAK0123102.1 hypothetical protein ONS96_010108 [Cadophora gregata f. sp. sojae]